MIKLSNAINGLFKNLKTNPMFLVGSLENKWEEIIGKHISQATTPIKIERGNLYLKCKNPTWKNELQYQKKELIKQINQHMKTNKIKNIILI